MRTDITRTRAKGREPHDGRSSAARTSAVLLLGGTQALVREETPTETPLHATREQWLQAAVAELRPVWHARAGIEVPEVRVGVGFPSRGRRSKTIGECWERKASEDGVCEITVRITEREPVQVLAITGHEMIHAALDCTGGHGRAFSQPFKRLGYVGKPTQCVLGPGLREELERISSRLGPYPGQEGLRLGGNTSGPKKQGTRMIKVSCPDCAFVMRTSQRWIDFVNGVLACPNTECDGTMIVDGAGEGE